MTAGKHDAVVDQMLADDFRLEREDAHIRNFSTGEETHYVGARVHTRNDKGRWAKTDLWLVTGPDKANTVAEVLRSFASVLDRHETEAP